MSIWKIIDRKSKIDPLNEDGVKLDKFQGDVEFCDVKFHYPSRPEVPVSIKKTTITILLQNVPSSRSFEDCP